MAKKKKTARIKKANTSKWGRPEGAVKITHIFATVSIPSGKCPVELLGNDRESIYEWVVKVTQKKPDNTTYLPSVYKYWVRDFYESYTQEYRDVGVIIDSIVSDPVAKVSDIK